MPTKHNFRLGDYFLPCLDGYDRWCPSGLEPALHYAFSRTDKRAGRPTGAIKRFDNGVIVQFWSPEDEPPKHKLLYNTTEDLDNDRCMLLKGPIPAKSHLPPIISDRHFASAKMAVMYDKIEIWDSVIMPPPDDYESWMVDWPNFEMNSARHIINTLLFTMQIPNRIRFKPLEPGIWLAYASGRTVEFKDVRYESKKTGLRKLRGSKYPWEDLLPDVPMYLRGPSISALQNSFRSWTQRRGLPWRIIMETREDGIIQVTRLAMPLRLVEGENDRV